MAAAEAMRNDAGDLYRLPHRALRSAMAQGLADLQAARAEHDPQPLLARWQALADLLRSQMRCESEVLHAALEARWPGSSWRSGLARDASCARLDDLMLELRQLARTPAAGRGPLLERLTRHARELVAQQRRQMAEQEALDAPALALAYPGSAALLLLQRLLARLHEDEQAALLHWMRQALDPAALRRVAQALEAVGANAQGPQITSLSHPTLKRETP